MKIFIFLVVNLAVSTASPQNQKGPEIEDIGQEKSIAEANKDSVHDDILKPPNIQRSSTNNDGILWPSPVPYVLDGSLDMNAKGVIMLALDQFRLKSCIDFRERDMEDYYIKAQKLDGCFSYIGRVISGGQDLSIGQFCDSISTVEHEFLHALGYNHEQSRYDRDNYVSILFENILQGYEGNFDKVAKESSKTNGISYDYESVMHYGADFFSNGNGSTIITKDPKFQDVIGQRIGFSNSDVKELNLRYQCNSTVAFQMYCGFTDGNTCQMTSCSQYGRGWVESSFVPAGPPSDHTNLPAGNKTNSGQTPSSFMHASTASGMEGDSAWMETKRMSPKRDCNVQCLQFYYFHSGNESDELNIWIREFENPQDLKGTSRLMGQITGPPKPHWQLKYISLNATKDFQVEFQAYKGAGYSKGGFSIDDINLSEIECPHVTLQIDNFEHLLSTSPYGTAIKSPRKYSRGGYAYSVGVLLYESVFGVYVQLLSGDYDDKLKWPVPQRQVTFQMVDQTPNILHHMTKQRSITSDTSTTSSGKLRWGNPREVGTLITGENQETIYAGPLIGQTYFATLEEAETKQYLKGGSAIFAFNFQNLTPLVSGSTLPCPELRPVPLRQLSARDGPCFSGTPPPIVPTTDEPMILPITNPSPPSKTTDYPKIRPTPTTYPPPPPRTTDDNKIRPTPTTYPPPPPRTTDDNKIRPTTFPPSPPPRTTDDNKIKPTTFGPPMTTECDSVMCFSPGLVSCPILILVTLMRLIL